MASPFVFFFIFLFCAVIYQKENDDRLKRNGPFHTSVCLILFYDKRDFNATVKKKEKKENIL